MSRFILEASSGAWGAPRAPQNGSFPLDHFGECSTECNSYLQCLYKNRSNAAACAEMARQYLICRVDNGLMLRKDFEPFAQRTTKAASSLDDKHSQSDATAQSSNGADIKNYTNTTSGRESLSAITPGLKESLGFLAGIKQANSALDSNSRSSATS